MGQPEKNAVEKVNVLFVCLGNICRSPMAQAIFRALVMEQGLAHRIETDSAGTGNWHIGSAPHHGTLEILEKYQIDEQGIFARQLRARDFNDYQYIICMDEDNLYNAQHFCTGDYHGECRLMLEYDPNADLRNVPDPYFTGDFEQTYRLLTAACKHLLAHIVTKHNIS